MFSDYGMSYASKMKIDCVERFLNRIIPFVNAIGTMV